MPHSDPRPCPRLSHRDLAAKGRPALDPSATRYCLSRLRDDYRRQWGKVLSLMPLAFGNLVELMQWELFADLLRVEEPGEGGRGEQG